MSYSEGASGIEGMDSAPLGFGVFQTARPTGLHQIEHFLAALSLPTYIAYLSLPIASLARQLTGASSNRDSRPAVSPFQVWRVIRLYLGNVSTNLFVSIRDVLPMSSPDIRREGEE